MTIQGGKEVIALLMRSHLHTRKVGKTCRVNAVAVRALNLIVGMMMMILEMCYNSSQRLSGMMIQVCQSGQDMTAKAMMVNKIVKETVIALQSQRLVTCLLCQVRELLFLSLWSH